MFSKALEGFAVVGRGDDDLVSRSLDFVMNQECFVASMVLPCCVVYYRSVVCAIVRFSIMAPEMRKSLGIAGYHLRSYTKKPWYALGLGLVQAEGLAEFTYA
jgi:hypothetical protein